MARARLVGVGILVLALSGCWVSLEVETGVHSPGQLVEQVRDIEAGDCFRAGEVDGRENVDLTDQVPCTEPHEYEVLRQVAVPEEFVQPVAEMMAGPGYTRLFHHAMPKCAEALVDRSGLGASVGSVPGLDGDVGLRPAVHGGVRFVIPPQQVWDAHPIAFCVFAVLDRSGGTVTMASSSDDPVIATYGTRETWADLRTCLTGDPPTSVGCGVPHRAELLFEFDAERVLGSEWVADVDPTVLTDDVRADLAGVCESAAEVVYGADRTSDVLELRGVLSPEAWGPVPETGLLWRTSYPVACAALTTDPAELLDGTVWGIGDGPAPVVPAE